MTIKKIKVDSIEHDIRAGSADKLNTNAGSATSPVYFANGVPVECTYDLNKTVPSNAVFTDTKNTAGSTNSSSKLFLIGATSQAADPQTYSHDTAYVGTDGCLYSNSTKVSVNGHTHSDKLDKLTYEWNKQYNAGGIAGYLLIGSFPMYDSNVTIDIDSTTTTTYHGTVVIATQNVSETSMGSAHTITVYGDPTGAISDAIRVVWTSGSRNYNVYFVPSTWSKNLIHIRAIGNYLENTDTSKICTQFTTGTAPATTSGLTVVNALKSNFATSSHNHAASNITSGTLDAARLPAATSSALGGVKVGSNITNSSGTISLTKANVTSALGYTPPTSDTNTDTKVTSSVNNSSKIYFTGTSNSAGETNTQLFNVGIFADMEPGYLHITNLLHIGGDESWTKILRSSTDTLITNSKGNGILKLSKDGVLSLSTNSGSSFTNVSLEGHTHNYAAASHTHNYAGSSSAGGAATSANKVNKSLTVKLNSGTTEGTNLFTFNGSAAKTVNITPSAIGAAEDNHKHEVLLNYGSYGTQILELNATGGTNGKGATYIDASSIEGTRSYLMLNAEGVASLNGLEVTSTSNPVTPNASSYRSYDTDGVQKSLIWLSTSNNLIVGNADGSAALAHSGHTYICAPNGNVRIQNSGQELIYNMSDNMGFFRPVTTNKNCLGGSSYRWQTIYAKNAVNTSSDYYQKENIQEMPQKYIDMLDDIEPVIFKFKDGDRLHGGYISQWVEESMEKYGITAEEFGGFCKDPKLDENEEVIEGEYEYSLRYSEFVPIIHAKMKQLNKEYKEEINKLKEEINELKLLIN